MDVLIKDQAKDAKVSLAKNESKAINESAATDGPCTMDNVHLDFPNKNLY